MTGCDGCGGEVRRTDVECPICGAAVPALAGLGAAAIPVRRYGTVPPPPAGSGLRLPPAPPAGGWLARLLLLLQVRRPRRR